jgi:hypothetical protein
MRNIHEIEQRIKELTPQFELAEEAYFSTVQEKQEGGEIYEVDFLKIESEYEILKKELGALQWVLEGPEIVVTTEHIIKEKRDESTLSD